MVNGAHDDSVSGKLLAFVSGKSASVLRDMFTEFSRTADDVLGTTLARATPCNDAAFKPASKPDVDIEVTREVRERPHVPSFSML